MEKNNDQEKNMNKGDENRSSDKSAHGNDRGQKQPGNTDDLGDMNLTSDDVEDRSQ
jgi:hypothetical protein